MSCIDRDAESLLQDVPEKVDDGYRQLQRAMEFNEPRCMRASILKGKDDFRLYIYPDTGGVFVVDYEVLQGDIAVFPD